jgi:hypothetical protein
MPGRDGLLAVTALMLGLGCSAGENADRAAAGGGGNGNSAAGGNGNSAAGGNGNSATGGNGNPATGNNGGGSGYGGGPVCTFSSDEHCSYESCSIYAFLYDPGVDEPTSDLYLAFDQQLSLGSNLLTSTGLVTFTSTADPAVFALLDPTKGVARYPADLFGLGDTLRISSAGGELPEFESSVAVPPAQPLRLVDAPSYWLVDGDTGADSGAGGEGGGTGSGGAGDGGSAENDQDLSPWLEWAPIDEGELVVHYTSRFTPDFNVSYTVARCSVPLAEGRFDLPSARREHLSVLHLRGVAFAVTRSAPAADAPEVVARRALLKWQTP